MTTRPITVLVPAYRPERIRETIGTLVAQDFQDFIVRIGYDHAPDYAAPDLPVGKFLLDVIHWPKRLGWVGNVNQLLASVETPYFITVAHDDGLSPGFLSGALQALHGNPDAIVAHGATEHRGIRGGELATTEAITGTRFERASEFIRRGPHHAELGWRGLIRRNALPTVPRLRNKLSDGQFSNTLFALELLFYGTSVPVEDIFYIKNTSSHGLSRDLVSRSRDAKSAMLADNLACVAEALADVGALMTFAERERVLTDYAYWLLKLQGPWNVFADEKDSSRRRLRDVREPIATFVARALLSSCLHATKPTRETQVGVPHSS